MYKKSISFDYLVFDSMDQMTEADRSLMEKAIQARENAYAPYSGFRVGAAVLLANGQITIGNNQENASYPSGLCAERVAVFQAGASQPDIEIIAIAISAASEHMEVDRPAAPCGNCRQSIAEYEQRQEKGISIVMMGATGKIYKCHSVSDLLPFAFGRSNLE